MFRILCFVLLVVGVSCQTCTANHPFVGLSFKLNTLYYDVSGTIFIKNDCEFEIQDFNYVQQLPQAFVLGVASQLENGVVPQNALTYELRRVPDVEYFEETKTLTVALLPKLTWDDIKAISIQDTAFRVDVATVTLEVLPEPFIIRPLLP